MRTSYLNDWNADLLDEYHQRWKKDPASVDATWSAFFEGFELGNSPNRNGHKTAAAPFALSVDAELQNRVDALVTNYRILGHTQAKLDPLAVSDPVQPALKLEALGLADVPGSTVVASRYFQNGKPLKLSDLISSLNAIYSGTVGVEFMHIQNEQVREWVRERIEARFDSFRPDANQQKQLLLIGIRAKRIKTGFNSDRKSTRLNSSHTVISYAVFCL